MSHRLYRRIVVLGNRRRAQVEPVGVGPAADNIQSPGMTGEVDLQSIQRRQLILVRRRVARPEHVWPFRSLNLSSLAPVVKVGLDLHVYEMNSRAWHSRIGHGGVRSERRRT